MPQPCIPQEVGAAGQGDEHAHEQQSALPFIMGENTAEKRVGGCETLKDIAPGPETLPSASECEE